MPHDLHFRDPDETDWTHELDWTAFEEWLTEGRHNCDVAQGVLHAWTSTVRGTNSDTLHEFYHMLLCEFAREKDSPDLEHANMQILHLAEWVLHNCTFANVLDAKTPADKTHELAEWIAEEVAVVSAYTTTWRGSTTLWDGMRWYG